MKRVLSLGAGVQSSVVLLMSCSGQLPKLDAAVFADTGWEPKAVYDWLEGVLRPEASKAGIPLLIVQTKRKGKGSSIRDDEVEAEIRGEKYMTIPYRTVKEDGSVGIVRRQCTTAYKIEPVARAMRRLAGLKPRKRLPKKPVVEKWLGISVDEAHRMKDSRDAWCKHVYPLIEHDPPITRLGCITWLREHGYPEAPRSACIGCPYRNNDDWRHLKRTSPDEFEDACRFDEQIRNRGGGDQLFIHNSAKPLREADLTTEYDHGQLSLFGNECEGMCGV